ncbi:hypothetical protein [Nocardia yunnanensis]|uniref:hypothetical protein n=1 Tax=Nocardia yunnanensis TaxID=2382165 RepID=UPI001FE84578|nr:hypothetical protein [Nocardia yunnanensis]
MTAVLTVVAAPLTLCTRSSVSSARDGKRLEVWDSWRHTAIQGYGWAAHLLAGALALSAFTAFLAGLLLLAGVGATHRGVRRFGALAAGMSSAVAATTVGFVLALKAGDIDTMSTRHYPSGYTETLGKFVTTPKAGFWVLAVVAVIAVGAALSVFVGERTVAPTPRRAGDVAGSVLLLAATALALAGSFVPVDESHRRGLSTVLAAPGSATPLWVVNAPVILTAILAVAAACGLCARIQRGRPVFRVLAWMSAGGLFGFLVTTLLEAVSQMLLRHDWLLHYASAFWYLTAAVVMVLVAMIAGRVPDPRVSGPQGPQFLGHN